MCILMILVGCVHAQYYCLSWSFVIFSFDWFVCFVVFYSIIYSVLYCLYCFHFFYLYQCHIFYFCCLKKKCSFYCYVYLSKTEVRILFTELLNKSWPFILKIETLFCNKRDFLSNLGWKHFWDYFMVAFYDKFERIQLKQNKLEHLSGLQNIFLMLKTMCSLQRTIQYFYSLIEPIYFYL